MTPEESRSLGHRLADQIARLLGESCAGIGNMLPVVVMCLFLGQAAHAVQITSDATPLKLDIGDDGKQLKLLVHRREIGQVCELWCYEGGPFRYGKATRRDDGSVVFVHNSGRMRATTTFTPTGQDRVLMDIAIEGPIEELHRVSLMGPCMQFWHSETFRRQETLVEFASRCFLYTMRGPVGMMDTARGQMKGYKPDAPENNPPWTQWYVPFGRAHPGDIWAFGASGDRPIHDLVGVASRDRKWLAAIGCRHTTTLGQGWHDCIHHVPDMQKYLDAGASRIVHRSVLYVMPNDKRKLLESFRQDFEAKPAGDGISVSVANHDRLAVSTRSPTATPFDLSLVVDNAGRRHRAVWKASSWGGHVSDCATARLWAYAHDGAVELWASAPSSMPPARVEASLGGKGWRLIHAPKDVPAIVQQSPDGAWTAAIVWEQREASNPGTGVVAPGTLGSADVSVRGRLLIFKGSVAALPERWVETQQEWRHSIPYRMPSREPKEKVQASGVRFAPNAEPDMTYGLSIVSP